MGSTGECAEQQCSYQKVHSIATIEQDPTMTLIPTDFHSLHKNDIHYIRAGTPGRGR